MYNDNIDTFLDINFFQLNDHIIYPDVHFENMAVVIFWYGEEKWRDEEEGECFFKIPGVEEVLDSSSKVNK